MSKNKFANTNLSTAIKKQYLDASTADMHFTFDSSASKIKPIPAHKSFLVASSDVFRDMFSKSSKKNDSVEIDDATAVAFKEFLQFFYCDEVKLSLKNVEEVFRLGHKYHVAACINICTQLLLKNVTDENVCSVYGLGILADQDELKALCEMNIGTKPTEIFKTSGFLKCDREVMRNILMLDSLSCSEMEVFNGCMDWVRAKSKDKLVDKTTALAHLGNSLYDIRFGLMTKDEVNEIFSSYKNLFTADERTEIIKVITSKDTKSTMIKAKPRNWDWEKKSLIKCVRKIVPVEYRSNAVGKIYPYEIRQPEISTFTVNAVLMLRAVVCGKLKFFRKYQWLQEIYDDLENVELKVIESSVAFKATQIKKKYGFNDEDHEVDNTGGKKVLYVDDEVTISEGETTVIQLKKPILVKPGLYYRISVALDDADEPYCTDFKVKDTEIKLEDGIVVKFSHDGKQGGFLRNFIHGLHFSKP